MTKRVILIGTGGWGRTWARNTLPSAVREGLIEVVAAVDTSLDSLQACREALGLADQKMYTDYQKAIVDVPADVCVIATPPDTHADIAIFAMEHGCHVLSEKPIANTLEATMKVIRTAQATGRKMAITMSHRFRQPIWTLREQMNSGRYGKLDYIVFHFNWNVRDKQKERQTRLPHAMLIEGAVHHLDLLEALASAPCRKLYASTWTPDWTTLTGSAQALMNLEFENDVRAMYETAWCNASSQNGWEQEYIRAEFENATLVLNRGILEVFRKEDNQGKERIGYQVQVKESRKWANDYLLEQFIRWIEGGSVPETNVFDNARSVLLLNAAIESGDTGQPIDIAAFAASHGFGGQAG